MLDGSIEPPPPPGLNPASMSYGTDVRIEAIVEMGPPIVPRLLEIILREDYAAPGDPRRVAERTRQKFAALALETLGDRSSIEPLADAMQDLARPVELRITCARILAHRFADARVGPFAHALAFDRSAPSRTREAGIALLSMLGLREHVPGLRGIAADEQTDARVRSLALSGLRELRDPELPRLCTALLGQVAAEDLRYHLVWLLGSYDEAQAIAVLEQVARNDSSERVRREASRSIGRIRAQARRRP